MLEHVVLIGLNYQLKRSSGDKNFWAEMTALLARGLQRITVLSIRKHPTDSEELTINGCNISIRYISPKFLESPDSNYKRKFFWRNGAFPRGLGILEKLLNVQTLRRELIAIHNKHPFQHIHLMDNMGFANFLLARRVPVSVTVSAMAYQGGQKKWLYHLFLRISYSNNNLTVIPYSKKYKEKLLQIGIEQKRISQIPWGVFCNSQNFSEKLDDMNLPKLPLILWTGYIQQIQKADFLFAIDIAIKALEGGLKVIFFFAFKPESFEYRFKKYHAPEKGLFVQPTSMDEFSFLKKRCNVLFSPVVSSDVVLAPPLSWLEMLQNGVPIITTNVPGASEAVVDGKTGFIAENKQDLISKLLMAIQQYPDMTLSCIEMIKNNYNITDTADAYLKLWQELVDKRRINGHGV